MRSACGDGNHVFKFDLYGRGAFHAFADAKLTVGVVAPGPHGAVFQKRRHELFAHGQIHNALKGKLRGAVHCIGMAQAKLAHIVRAPNPDYALIVQRGGDVSASPGALYAAMMRTGSFSSSNLPVASWS